MKATHPGIWMKGRLILTKNRTPGVKLFEYGQTRSIDGVEYRVFDPKRSKLAAAIAKGLQQTGITEESRVLYLGASHGYTPSFISDIAAFVYCIDVAPRVVKDLVFVCEARVNMAPLLADANRPEEYAQEIPTVDVVYQDIAQRNQLEIFTKNCDQYLAPGGKGLLAIKARSIDVTGRPREIFKQVRRAFEGPLADRFVIIDYRELDPFEQDHAFFVVKRR